MEINIRPDIITTETFSTFGDIISMEKHKSLEINKGYALKYDDLAKIDVTKNQGKPKVSIFDAKARKFPIKIEMMERHPLGSQAFLPYSNCIFLIVVSPCGDKPVIDNIKAFVVPRDTGINYHAGVWHYPLIATIESKFFVIDRKADDQNLELFNFSDNKIMLHYE